MSNAQFSTQSKVYIDYENFTEDMVDLEDIALGLSRTYRSNGQLKSKWTVLDHTILVYELMKSDGHDNDMLLYALLHDASEAYVGDIVSPLKKLLPQFKEIENKIEAKIMSKYGLEHIVHNSHDLLKKYDTIALHLELFFLDANKGKQLDMAASLSNNDYIKIGKKVINEAEYDCIWPSEYTTLVERLLDE